MASTVGYSDLEVAGERQQPDLEVVPGSAQPYQPIQYDKVMVDYNTVAEPAPKRIWGLAPKTFWLLAAGVLIVIGAAIGGGIGGALSKNDSADGTNVDADEQQDDSRSSSTSSPATTSSDISSSASITPTPSSSSSTSIQITTTEVVGPKQTLLRDCPSSNDTIYNAIGSVQLQFRKLCGNSYVDFGDSLVNAGAGSLDDCIDMCATYNIKNRDEIESGGGDYCGTVCWRNTFDTDWPGQCFGGALAGNATDGGFRVTKDPEVVCDSGAWINPWFLE